MRRLLVAVLLTGLSLSASACSTAPEEEPEGTAPIVAAPPSAIPAPAPGGGVSSASTGSGAVATCGSWTRRRSPGCAVVSTRRAAGAERRPGLGPGVPMK